MKTEFITFRSVTPTQRAQRALQRAGIDAVIQRTPRWMEERGCGYCLRLDSSDVERAVAVLQVQQIHFSKIYTTIDGKPEERLL